MRVGLNRSSARTRIFLSVLTLFSLTRTTEAFGQAGADIVWTKGASGNWNEAGSWSTGSVPGPSDKVSINLAGSYTVTLDANATIAALALGEPGVGGLQTLEIASGSNLTINGPGRQHPSGQLLFQATATLTSNDNFDYHGGTIRGAGNFTNNGNLNVPPGAVQTVRGGVTIDNSGVTLLISNDLRGGEGAVLMNQPQATVEFHDGFVASSFGLGGVPLVLDNSGILVKKDGPGLAEWALPLDNTGGLIDVRLGALKFSRGGRSTGGTFNVPDGATLDLLGGRHILSGTFSGATDGLVPFDIEIDPKGATFDFPDNGFNWAGGTLFGSGVLTNKSNFNILSGFIHTMRDTAAIHNQGLIRLSSADFRGGESATITNLQGGTIELADGASASQFGLGGVPLVLINSGQVAKPFGADVARWNLPFDNTGESTSSARERPAAPNGAALQGGIIDVREGTLELARGGNSTGGTIMVAAGATLDFTGAFHNFAGLYTGMTDGSVILHTQIDAAGATFDFPDPGLNWSRGTITGPGTLTNDGTLNITSTAFHTLRGSAVVENAGRILFDSSDLRGGEGSTINNLAGATFEFVDGASASQFSLGGIRLTLVNSGLLSKIAGGGTSTWGLLLDNAGGTIDVQSGTLRFTSGGSSTGGTIAVTDTATLDFSGALHNFAGSYSGGADGSVILNMSIDPSGANFNFPGKGLNWTGGTVQGPGTFSNLGTLNISGTGPHNLRGNAVLDNSALISVTASDVRGGEGAVINNLANGTFEFFDGASASQFGLGGARLALANSGLVTKTQGDGTATWGLVFDNVGGIIDVQAGSLILSSGGSSSGGTLNVSANATLDFRSALHNFAGVYNGTTDGSVVLNTQIDPAGATFDFPGKGLNWTAGTVRGPGSLTNTGILNLATASFHTLAGGLVLDNAAIINLSSADIRGGEGATLNNLSSGTIEFLDGAESSQFGLGGVALTLNNAGQVSKTTGVNTAIWGLPFSNEGTVEVQAGNLEFGSSFTQTAGTTILNGGSLSANSTLDISGGSLSGAGDIFANVSNGGQVSPGGSPGGLNISGSYTQTSSGELNIELGGLAPRTEFDQINVSSTATLDGTLNLSLINQFAPTEGDAFEILSFGANTGTNFSQINGQTLAGGLMLNPVLGPNNLVLQAGRSALSVAPTVLDFGNVVVSNTVTQSAALTNEGTTDVNITALRVTGANPANFVLNAQPFSLTPAETRTLDVQFTPDFIGGFSALLDIDSNAGTVNIQLSGTGVGSVNPDSLVLVDLFNTTDGPNWTNNTNWLSNQPIDTWFGVTAVQGSVTALSLQENSLVGTLPATIGDLIGLAELILSTNQLDGNIPTTLGNLIDLTQLRLEENQLTGAIPPEFGNLANLIRMDLSFNNLSGPLPPSLGNLNNLQALEVLENQLTGTIPPEIGDLVSLELLDLSSNQISGSIPIEIGNLANLTNLTLNDNQLSGSLPVELTTLTSLGTLHLERNQLSGSIPSEVGQLANLSFLKLAGNRFSGPIPAEIGSLSNLIGLDLYTNQFTGALPAELGNLSQLTGLSVFGNQLSGAISANFANLGSLQQLHVFDNDFNDFPDLSSIGSLSDLQIQENGFTFEDIEPNVGIPSFIYAPQDSVGSRVDTTAVVGANLTMSVSVGGDNNQYQWFQNGAQIGGATETTFTIASAASQNAGAYTCRITNTVATDLTLVSRPINVTVGAGQPALTSSASAVDFGTVVVDETMSQTLQITNSGTGNLMVTATTIGGTHAGEFSIASGGGAATLAASQARDITLVFAPQTEGDKAAFLVIASDAATSPDTVGLSGMGGANSVRVELPTPPTPGSEQPLTIMPPANLQPTTSQLFYRRAGETVYRATNLAPSGNGFLGTIPADFVTIRGVEYYIVLSDGETVVTFPETDPESNPVALIVLIGRTSYPTLLPPQTYKMISIPINLRATHVDSVLTDDYGPYDVLPRQWRLFRYENNAYAEYLDIGAPFVTRAGFWLITRDGLGFDLENARSVSSAQPIPINLLPGWNQIGNPFAFPVDWSDVSKPGNVQAPVSFDGTEYQFNVVTLEPWEGYFVFNPNANPVNLTVPPQESAATSPPLALTAAADQSNEYVLQVVASVPGTELRDTQNFVGFKPGASNGADALDFLEPPPIGQFVHVSIVDDGHQFAGNFKALHGSGQEWSLEITSSQKNRALISFRENGQLPDGFERFVFDQDHYRLVPLDGHSFSVEIEDRFDVRSFRIVLGNRAFAEDNQDGIPLIPLEFALAPNFPNPFNPETTIHYQISKPDLVSLEIYNLLGQRIRTLVHEKQNAGFHSVKWHGRDDAGRAAPSGVYLYRLSAGEFTTVRKLALIR